MISVRALFSKPSPATFLIIYALKGIDLPVRPPASGKSNESGKVHRSIGQAHAGLTSRVIDVPR